MLTDTQLVLLSAAAQRDDGLLTPLHNLTGKARQSCIAKLLARSLVEEVPITCDQHAWRDADDGGLVGLKITSAGLRAIGLDPEPTDDPEAGATDHDGADRDGRGAQTNTVSTKPTRAQPRAGSKQALVLALLARPEGASLDELVAATGWLPHTTRAALTRLRQGGFSLAKSAGEDGRSVYRITPAEDSGGGPDTSKSSPAAIA